MELPGSPAWLGAAMDHRGDLTYCELLERLGVHGEPAYGLLCGCQGAPVEHRPLVEPVGGDGLVGPMPADGLHSWADYYAARGLPPSSPLSTLLSFPLTLYHILQRRAAAGAPTASRILYLGPEKELWLLPLFRELAILLPEASLEIDMVGPVAFDLPTKPIVYEGGGGGRVTVRAQRGVYHLLASELPRADLVVALNAGLAAAGYSWGATLHHLARQRVPFYFTE